MFDGMGRGIGPVWALALAAVGAVAGSVLWWPVGGVAGAALPLVVLYGPIVAELQERGPSWTGWRVKVSPAAWNRYGSHWEAVMNSCGLAVTYRRKVRVPKLIAVDRRAHMDRLLVRLPVGMHPATMRGEAETIAHSFRRLDCRVRSHEPGLVHVDILHTDLLVESVPVNMPDPDRPEDVDLEALTIGRTETGEPWVVKLLGTHWLVGGATGSGKGSVLWSLILATGPLIKAGIVQWWVVDPKGGMEFGGPGEALYHRFSADDPEGQAALLREAVGVMKARQAKLAGKTRKHVPDVKHPLIAVVIDEFAAIVAYSNGSKQLRWEMVHNINLLLTQGRALGVVLVGAVQDARKQVMDNRDLFPTRVALRLDDGDTVLGRGAEAKGARTAEVRHPGTGFAWLDGSDEPMKVRAGHVRDGDIAEGARLYAPTSRRREAAMPVAPMVFDAPPDIDPGFGEIIDVPWAQGSPARKDS